MVDEASGGANAWRDMVDEAWQTMYDGRFLSQHGYPFPADLNGAFRGVVEAGIR